MRALKPGALLLFALAGGGAAAQPRSGSFDRERYNSLLRCTAIADPVARVVCYDSAAMPAVAAEAPPKVAKPPRQMRPAASPMLAVPQPSAPSGRPMPAATERRFGLDSIAAARRPKDSTPAQANAITARVVARSDQGAGLWRFLLDSGTSWETTETTPFDLPAAGDAVTIRRGKIGGYLMDVGSRSAVRVVRVR